MTKIIIVGEAYYSDLRPDQGLPPGAPPGIWGGPPLYPDQGLPGGQPRPSHPIAPGGRPPGIWGGPPAYPDQGLPGVPPGFWGGVAPPYPDQGLPAGPIGTPVPPDLMPPPAVPEEIASQYIVSVYNPKTMTWTSKSYPPPAA
jgi:hypothetical protein